MIRARVPEPTGEIVPNLAPMVDVIMVLLVFFMLGASLQILREGAFNVELDPRSGPGGQAAVEIIPAVKIGLEAVDNGRNCRIYVLGEPIEGNSFDALFRFMRGRREAGADTTNPVVIGAESSVRWRHVIAAMDASRRAGFKDIQFAVSLAAPARAGSTP